MQSQEAETIALEALGFIVADEPTFSALQAQTGMGPDDLRAGAADPQVLGALLDFILDDDRRTIAFCEACQLEPEMPMRARVALPGATAGIW